MVGAASPGTRVLLWETTILAKRIWFRVRLFRSEYEAGRLFCFDYDFVENTGSARRSEIDFEYSYCMFVCTRWNCYHCCCTVADGRVRTLRVNEYHAPPRIEYGYTSLLLRT